MTAEEEAEWKYPTPESEDASVCTDCHRHVKRPGRGVGTGTKRWELKIYAANGLMRAGAWSAAWSEMERCDVEISPWIPDDMRKALDKRLQEEEEAAQRKHLYAAELERQIAEGLALQKKSEEEAEAKRRAEDVELKRRIEVEAAVLQQKLEEQAAENRRLEDTLDEKIEEAKETIRLEFEAQALAEAHSIAERLHAMEDALKREQERATTQAPPPDVPTPHYHTRSRSRGRPQSISRRPTVHEIPIGTLLKNYMLLQLRDSRNYLIVILGALVIFLAMNANHDWSLTAAKLGTTPGNSVGSIVDAVPSIVITSTATTTATSVATLIVTESEQIGNAYETPISVSSTITVEEKELETSVPLLGALIPSEEAVDEPLLANIVSEDHSEAMNPSTSMPTPTVLEEAFTSASSFIASSILDETEAVLSAVDLENALHEPATPEPTSSAADFVDTELSQETNISDAQEPSEVPLETLDKDEL